MGLRIKMFKKSITNSICNKKGMAYLEFILFLFVYIIIIYSFVKFYFLIRAQTELMTVTRRALRQIEVYGGIIRRENIWGQGVKHLEDAFNISEVEMFVTANGQTHPIDFYAAENTNYWVQVRSDVKLTVKAKYVFSEFFHVTIPLSISYTGTSSRLRKDANPVDYDPVFQP